MKRNYWVDVYFCSIMIFFIVSAYVLSYISTTMGILGETEIVSIEYRIFQDVTFMSVWCTTYSLIYFIVKLFLTITRGKTIYFKYIEFSVCIFASITMIVTTIGFIINITPEFLSDISRYRMVVNHYIIPIGLIVYLIIYRVNYIYNPKEIIISAVPNAIIVTLYAIWITFAFSKPVLKNENVPFPYMGMNYTDIGIPMYVCLLLAAFFVYGFFTSIALTINNTIIIKYHSHKFEPNHFKQNIFNNYESYERNR